MLSFFEFLCLLFAFLLILTCVSFVLCCVSACSYVPMTGYADCVWNANGTLNAVNARLLARTYARAVAGHTMHMQFNATTSVFSLQYRMDPAIKLPTEIFYSADLHYPKGISVQLLPAGVAQASQAGTNVLEIRPTPEATAATVLSVVISPK